MLKFADPCGQFYSTTTQATSGLWTTLSSAVIHTSGLPAGNIGSTAFSFGTLGGTVATGGTLSTYIFGWRMCFTGSYGGSSYLIQFTDQSNNPQVSITFGPGGVISAYRGTISGTLLGTSSVSGTVLLSNVWQYVEVQVTISSTVGVVTARINGTTVLSLTSQNTQNQTNSTIGFVQIGNGSGGTFYVQDIYICDTTGTYNNTFLGDVHISVYNAAGAGTSGINQYTPNGAATVWQSVSATTPADSTIFASDSTPGDRMSVLVSNTSVTGTIAGIIHVTRMEKNNSGTRTASQTITSNGVDSIASAVSLGTSYAYYTQVQETDPNTGIPWTTTGFNSVQCGVETVT